MPARLPASLPSRHRVSYRLLASLSSPSLSSSSTNTTAPFPSTRTPVSSLLPPYSHSSPSVGSTPNGALRPPYEHSVPPKRAGFGSKLGSKYRLKLINSSLTTPASGEIELGQKENLVERVGEEVVMQAWGESLSALERIRNGQSAQSRIPEISFLDLAQHLSSPSVVQAIKATGGVVIRDVVSDSQAEEWAREVGVAMEECDGRPVFWHPALLEARGNPSILSALKQLLTSLSNEENLYIQAESISRNPTSSLSGQMNLDSPWSTSSNSRAAPTSPLTAHLALSPSRINLPSTIHSATYSALRSFFQPKQSRISFYDKEGYLNPSNWVFSPNAVSSSSSSKNPEGIELPHLEGTFNEITLGAGDILLRQSSIPTSAEQGQGIFLPTSPLPGSVNETYLQTQKEAFQNGLPPPSPFSGSATMAVVEPRGEEGMIPSRIGRQVMGYPSVEMQQDSAETGELGTGVETEKENEGHIEIQGEMGAAEGVSHFEWRREAVQRHG